MAQPSVVREPSMEEILASIRRIIESNDPATAAEQADEVDAFTAEFQNEMEASIAREQLLSAANDPAPSPKVERSLAAERLVEPERAPASQPIHQPQHVAPAVPVQQTVRIELPRAEAPRVEAPRIEPQQAEPQKTVSLADLAARVRSAAERAVQQGPAATSRVPLRAPQAPVPQAQAPVVEAPRMANFGNAELRPHLDPMMTKAPAAAEPIAPSQEDRSSPLGRMASVEVKQEKGVPLSLDNPAASLSSRSEPLSFEASAPWGLSADEDGSAEEETGGNALVSMTTVEQVNRSFSDLAAAIDGQQRRSLDEMAEEMLRPMLKEWLDDNLPTLVERLVREEIERVARGPRR
ncbi:PopZ family protein [Peteryoungia ipomoeae]|uniref:DUF2497 domain-containing protein n=1 Tax=Peteryoungia ipomoeae TaxID=1210932 RepID=A0A4S8P7F8_9HYPH|nr:DUF2497 domain-containing protein [Peteryoungia ipomoeae]THV25395.1 DUF2497 domain-containing protein [Peteryoungia ipomoeae]